MPLALVGVLAAGCGLIDPNITDFDLNIRERSFTIDTEQWGLAEGPTFPEIPCDPGEDQCMAASEAACASEACSATCVANLCQVTVQVGLAREVDLLKDNQELRTINRQPLVSVRLGKVEFKLEENTLDFATPEITVYVAPHTIMDLTSLEARAIATVPSVAAGVDHDDWQEVQLTPQGESDLLEFMGDYETRFNVLVGAPVTIMAGTPTPTGHAVAKLRVTATAGI